MKVSQSSVDEPIAMTFSTRSAFCRGCRSCPQYPLYESSKLCTNLELVSATRLNLPLMCRVPVRNFCSRRHVRSDDQNKMADFLSQAPMG